MFLDKASEKSVRFEILKYDFDYDYKYDTRDMRSESCDKKYKIYSKREKKRPKRDRYQTKQINN